MATYLATGDFLSALFENWESEFLQMSAYVVLTAILFQRGSAESRDPDDPIRPGDVMTSSRLRPWLAWAYQHSLGMVLALLFVVSFMLHVVFSVDAANERAALHGAAPAGLGCAFDGRTTLVRVVSELAIGVLVDGGLGGSLDFLTAQRLARIQGLGCRSRRYRRVRQRSSREGRPRSGTSLLAARFKHFPRRKCYGQRQQQS